MPKKPDAPILSPGACIQSLQGYNESVIQLVALVKTLRDVIDPKFHAMLDRNRGAIMVQVWV